MQGSMGTHQKKSTAKKNKMADDGSLAKVLFFDIARQTRLTAGLSSVDAAN